MSLYQHTPPLVVFKKSVLFASILLAFSSQTYAQDWTYDRYAGNKAEYYFAKYEDPSSVDVNITQGFNWSSESNSLNAGESFENITSLYGINIGSLTDRIPIYTFKDFDASIKGLKVVNSTYSTGISTNATALIEQQVVKGEQLEVDNVSISFENVTVKGMLGGVASGPSNIKMVNSQFIFDGVQVLENTAVSMATIRGVSAENPEKVTEGQASIENSEVLFSNKSSANLAVGYHLLNFDNAVISGNTVTAENSEIKTLKGFYSQGNSFEIAKNTMSVTGGTFQSVRAIEVQPDGSADDGITISGNKLLVSNAKNRDAEIVGVYLSQEPLAKDITISNNLVSLSNSEVGSLSVVSVEGADKNLFKQGNTAKFSGSNTIHGQLAGFDRMEYDVSAANEKDAVLTLDSSVQNSFDDTAIKVNKGTDVKDGINYKLIAAVGSSAKFTNTTVESDATFVHSEWNVDDFTLNDGETLSVRWGEALDPDDPTDTPVLDPDNPSYQAVTENSKTLSESLLGTVAFLNQGAEFIADEGLAAMVDSAKLGELSAFGAVHGGTSNYKTGSRVDVDGYTLAAGGSIKLSPDWVVGGFIEAGWADSDGHVGHAKGEGDHDYYGVGLATRYMLNDVWYVDGSVRVGQASTEFTGLYAGDSAKYDSDAFYVTAHAGTGYLFNLTDSVNLDVYGRYLVTYLDGDDVRLHNKYDDKFDMDSTVTHAVRVGGRLTGSFCPYAGWKVGLAYEHVFDGDAESAVNSLNLEVPSLEGDTGVMEVGVTMKPSLNSRWSMDLGAKGYAGDREGVTGSVMVRYAF